MSREYAGRNEVSNMHQDITSGRGIVIGLHKKDGWALLSGERTRIRSVAEKYAQKLDAEMRKSGYVTKYEKRVVV